VVEHRAVDKNNDPKNGYVLPAEVIRMAKKAGFELVESSEINANARDTKYYKEGVWTLPPALRLGDKDKDKYLYIGESDRMTLKFRKP
jgi:predicted methyltransferase